MGAIAERLADIVIVTDDNPRSEDPATIRRAILAAAPRRDEIGDRARAIRAAISMLGPAICCSIAGKGHERGQIVGDTVLPFDDAAIARAPLWRRPAMTRALDRRRGRRRDRRPQHRRRLAGVTASRSTAARVAPGDLFVALDGPEFRRP